MTLYTDLDLVDGDGLRHDHVLRIEAGTITECRPRAPGDHGQALGTGRSNALVCPGFIDLQVNGGGGLMLGECTGVADLHRFASAHRAGGTLGLLPTLISDTPETTARLIDLVAEATRTIPAILGLHLEGPHIGVAGAHDPARLRPLSDADLTLYRDAARRLPHLMITLDPDVVPADKIGALAQAGIHVSLGHSACDYDTARTAFAAGAGHATHLFNAMSGLHHRAPGLVGAALDAAGHIGLIADGVHVHPAALRAAFGLRGADLCLVTDAMACAGTEDTSFDLQGRTIHRRDGRLALDDGTLAGADLTMAGAVAALATATGQPLETILSLAFDTPLRALTGRPARIAPDAPARLLCLVDGTLTAIHEDDEGWRAV